MSAIDGAMYLLNPGKVVVATAMSMMFYISLVFGDQLYDPFVPMWLYGAMILFNVIYIGIALRDASHKINLFKSYASLLFISYSYIPLFMWALVTFTKRVWIRTEHTKSTSLQEVEKAQVSA
ncbi:hypothetical protein [Paenibacillus sp. DCT19]|nr:hypothetical protein [Paenibacillus sp. DCT19]